MTIPSTLVVPDSRNSKLGPGWGVTYRPVGPTCPQECPLLDRVCYAQRAFVNWAQDRAQFAIGDISRLDGLSRVRWDVSGDNLRPDGSVDVDYLRAKYGWHSRNPNSVSLGYTHAPRALERAGFGPASFPTHYHLLASCHSRTVARALRRQGWQTARVMRNPAGKLDPEERLCPVDAAKHRGIAQKTNCAKCGLCFRSNHSIVFLEI